MVHSLKMFTQLVVCLFKKVRFQLFLKIFTLLTAIRLSGREFHKNGAATEKALSPVVLADLIAGRANKLLKFDLIETFRFWYESEYDYEI